MFIFNFNIFYILFYNLSHIIIHIAYIFYSIIFLFIHINRYIYHYMLILIFLLSSISIVLLYYNNLYLIFMSLITLYPSQNLILILSSSYHKESIVILHILLITFLISFIIIIFIAITITIIQSPFQKLICSLFDMNHLKYYSLQVSNLITPNLKAVQTPIHYFSNSLILNFFLPFFISIVYIFSYIKYRLDVHRFFLVLFYVYNRLIHLVIDMAANQQAMVLLILILLNIKVFNLQVMTFLIHRLHII